MAGWHHWLDGHESEWTLGVGDGQGGLACCDSWGCKDLDTTEQLNWTELNYLGYILLRNKNLFIYKGIKTYELHWLHSYYAVYPVEGITENVSIKQMSLCLILSYHNSMF